MSTLADLSGSSELLRCAQTSRPEQERPVGRARSVTRGDDNKGTTYIGVKSNARDEEHHRKKLK